MRECGCRESWLQKRHPTLLDAALPTLTETLPPLRGERQNRRCCPVRSVLSLYVVELSPRRKPRRKARSVGGFRLRSLVAGTLPKTISLPPPGSKSYLGGGGRLRTIAEGALLSVRPEGAESRAGVTAERSEGSPKGLAHPRSDEETGGSETRGDLDERYAHARRGGSARPPREGRPGSRRSEAEARPRDG
jgi:hypothetical protein